MTSLEKYQAEMFAYILGDDQTDVADKIATLSSSDAEIQRRLHVYRNNYLYSMSESLSDSFPVLHRLLGDDLFKMLARDYVQQKPPVAASLLVYGYDFLTFLAEHPACESLPFLQDIGHIEWLYIQCFHGPEVTCIDLYDLLDIDENHLPEVSFVTQPNVYLFHSKFPALEIWQANLEEEVPELDLSTLPATYLMLYRVNHDVIPMQLSPLAYYFLLALTQGKTIQMAWQQATIACGEQTKEEEVSDLLAFLIQKPIFQSLIITTEETP